MVEVKSTLQKAEWVQWVDAGLLPYPDTYDFIPGRQYHLRTIWLEEDGSRKATLESYMYRGPSSEAIFRNPRLLWQIPSDDYSGDGDNGPNAGPPIEKEKKVVRFAKTEEVPTAKESDRDGEEKPEDGWGSETLGKKKPTTSPPVRTCACKTSISGVVLHCSQLYSPCFPVHQPTSYASTYPYMYNCVPLTHDNCYVPASYSPRGANRVTYLPGMGSITWTPRK